MEDCQHCSAERVPSLKSGESRRDAPLLELCWLCKRTHRCFPLFGFMLCEAATA